MPDPTDEEWIEILQDEIESAEATIEAADEIIYGEEEA